VTVHVQKQTASSAETPAIIAVTRREAQFPKRTATACHSSHTLHEAIMLANVTVQCIYLPPPHPPVTPISPRHSQSKRPAWHSHLYINSSVQHLRKAKAGHTSIVTNTESRILFAEVDTRGDHWRWSGTRHESHDCPTCRSPSTDIIFHGICFA